MKKTETLNRLAESRQTFLHALEDLTEVQITQMPVEGNWTAKDLLGHLASWEKTCVVLLGTYGAGEVNLPEPIADHQVWNETQAHHWQDQSLAETLSEYQSVRDDLIMVVTNLTDQQWEARLPAPWGGEASVADLCSGMIWHESVEHLKSIQHWKETGKPR